MKIKNLKTKIFITLIILIYVITAYFLKLGCPVKKVIGFNCPGCGMTRALVLALRLDFKQAFSYHTMFWSVPILYIAFLTDGVIFKSKIKNYLLYSAILTGFFINWVFSLI